MGGPSHIKVDICPEYDKGDHGRSDVERLDFHHLLDRPYTPSHVALQRDCGFPVRLLPGYPVTHCDRRLVSVPNMQIFLNLKALTPQSSIESWITHRGSIQTNLIYSCRVKVIAPRNVCAMSFRGILARSSSRLLDTSFRLYFLVAMA